MTFVPDRLSVAPMMDWTDRHFRFMMRQITRRTLLYTEMVTAQAVVFGDAGRIPIYWQKPVKLMRLWGLTAST